MAKRDGSQMRFDLIDVSPDMATNWLNEANEGNRHISQRSVDLYAKDMAKGAFFTTHEAIAFDVNGRLIDGQHRLKAIEQSGKTVPLHVCTGCPVDTQKFVDACRFGGERALAAT